MAFFAGLAVRFHQNWTVAVTARLEQERADEVERRVAEERVLIAAELHDVLTASRSRTCRRPSLRT